jgi:hypothetical protein
VPGFPVATPTGLSEVSATFVAPLIDDIDGDNLVELLLVGGNDDLFIWNFEASYENGENMGRFLVDNLNTNILAPSPTSTDIADGRSSLPGKLALAQNYPNPFNPTTTFEFDLPTGSHVKIEVFNILGQKVTTTVDTYYPPGRHQVEFNGSEFASGLYLYRLKTDDASVTRKMVILK